MDDDLELELALRSNAELELREVTRTINRGVALILMVPVVVIGAVALAVTLDSLIPLIFGLAYVLVGGVVGGVTTALGIVTRRKLARELHDARHELPVARLLR